MKPVSVSKHYFPSRLKRKINNHIRAIHAKRIGKDISSRILIEVGSKLEEWLKAGRHHEYFTTIDEIADDMGVLREELTYFSKTKLGKSFLTWRKEYRIDEAKIILLKEPQTPVSVIAYRLGINDRSNLRTQFIKSTGMTPDEWRRKHQKK